MMLEKIFKNSLIVFKKYMKKTNERDPAQKTSKGIIKLHIKQNDTAIFFLILLLSTAKKKKGGYYI